MSKTMPVSINGETHQLPDAITLLELLERWSLNTRATAVERNGRIVGRDRLADCQLQPGDQLEIVTLAGGG